MCQNTALRFAETSLPERNHSASASTVPDTPNYEVLRTSLNDAAHDLLRLVNGPKNYLRSLFFSHYGLAALNVALKFKFFDHLPLPLSLESPDCELGIETGKAASIAEIAANSGLDENLTGRALRLLAAKCIFEEVYGSSGSFRHTAASALIANDPDFNAMGSMQ